MLRIPKMQNAYFICLQSIEMNLPEKKINLLNKFMLKKTNDESNVSE